jgi:tRNA G18 (ribose-2'-O)-methylase SpoU
LDIACFNRWQCTAAEPWPQALDTLRAAGFVTVALMPDGDAMAIGDFASSPAARGRVALIFGTEGDGLTRAAQDGADVRVRIPMHASGGRLTGALDSLNIAAAAGIALHRLHEVR